MCVMYDYTGIYGVLSISSGKPLKNINNMHYRLSSIQVCKTGIENAFVTSSVHLVTLKKANAGKRGFEKAPDVKLS